MKQPLAELQLSSWRMSEGSVVVVVESVIAGEVADDVKDKLRVGGGMHNKGGRSEEEGGVQKNFAVPPHSSRRREKKGEYCVVRQLEGVE